MYTGSFQCKDKIMLYVEMRAVIRVTMLEPFEILGSSRL